ncbi:MAG TPA: sugar ABC transporter substrate-binding protein [Gaiellaceae bacterium]
MTDPPNHDDLLEVLTGRRMNRRSVVLGAIGAAGAVVIGPAGSALGATRRVANTKQIAFAQPDTGASIWNVLMKGAKIAAKKRGYQLLESHANSQLDAQINELNTWIAQGIGGVIVLPLDNNSMGPLIKKAHAAGVKFLDYSDKALPGVDGWVIFNNPQGAQQVGTYAGQWVNKTLGGKAEVALLTHEIQVTGRQRIHGGIAALQKVAPGAKVVAKHEAVLSADALPVVQSMLQAHPNLNVILCIADDGCLGAERAFLQTNPSKARQAQMLIAGWDGSVPAIQKVLSGSTIRATGALDAIGIGEASIDATANAIEGKKPVDINFPYVLVSQSPAGIATGKKILKEIG